MGLKQLSALLPIICLSVSVLAVMLLIAIRRHFAAATSLACGGIIIALLAALKVWPQSPVPVTSLILIDHYGLLFMALLLLAGLTVIVFCYDYFKNKAGENEELLLLILTALLGGSVLVVSCHFATFFIGLEILSVSLFVLLGYSFDNLHALEAAIKYLILSGVSSAILLMGMALIYAQCGVLDFKSIGAYVTGQPQIQYMVLSGSVFVLAGVGFKLSLVPFQLWTPDVYEGAAAPVTAFIATVSKTAVFAVLLRYFISTGMYTYAPLITMLSVLATVTILIGNLLALLQQNIKRLLAYSSIAHMGYLLVVVIASGSILPKFVMEAISFYLLAYCIATLGVFGVISLTSNTQSETVDLADYQGLFWERPWLATSFTIMLLSLAGIPLTAGFIGKFYIFTVGAEGQLWWLMISVIIGSGLGLYYYLRIILTMLISNNADNKPKFSASFPLMTTMTIAMLTLLLIWLGVFPSYLLTAIPG